MEDYVIAVDASADIDETFFVENNIVLFPMEYSLGEKMISCSEMQSEERLKEFYAAQRNGELTRTSQITPYLYEQYATPYLEKGISVLYLALSSGLSSTYNSACYVAGEMKKKYPGAEFLPFDSLAATGGMGILAERAVRNKQKGMSLHQNFFDLEDAAKHLSHWFLVSDIQYLKRGGRISASAAVIASALAIKPILQIDTEGKLPVIEKVRGTKAAIRDLAKHYEEFREENEDPVYICHADAQVEADLLEEKIRALTPDVTIRKRYLCPVIGAHTGPGMVSVIHIGKKRTNLKK